MLTELAICDAYGAGFEYVPDYFTAENNDLKYYRQHPKWQLPAGSYTDDTQMALGTAEAVLEIAAGAVPTKELFTKYYLDAFWRDPRAGYAQHFYDFLLSVKSVEDFLNRIKPDSERSGGAMRASPIGVFGDVQAIKEIASLQASITHDTPLGRAAAVASALMPYYFLYERGKKKDLGKFLNKHVPIDAWNWTSGHTGKVGAAGWQSVAAAVTAIEKWDTLSLCLQWIVARRGDVDTAAAICAGAASCSEEIENDLPEALHSGLERGQFGYDYINTLDTRLMELVKR